MRASSVKLITSDNISYVCSHTGDTSSKFVNYNSSKSKSANELEGGTFTPYIVISTKHVLKQLVTIDKILMKPEKGTVNDCKSKTSITGNHKF